MGSPKQELLMRDCREVHPMRYIYGGGRGTYDVFTGHVKRAPQKYGRTRGWSGCIVCFLSRSVLPPDASAALYLRWHYTGDL